MFYKVIAHPRYFLGGHRPSETSILTISYIYYNRLLYTKLKIIITTVVSVTIKTTLTEIYKNTKTI